MSTRTAVHRNKPPATVLPSPMVRPPSRLRTGIPELDRPPVTAGFAGHDFGRLPLHAESPQTAVSFRDFCPLSLATPRACPFGGACHVCPLRVQAKMRLSRPRDHHEQEADRLAAQIVSREDAGAPGDREQTPPGPAPSGANLPLPPALRQFFEPRLGCDFGRVRVHSDGAAAQAADALGARAFTVGSDIFFGAHQYAPATRVGRGLLAHELAHVRQQGQDGPENAGLAWRKGKEADSPPTETPVDGSPVTTSQMDQITPGVERARELVDGAFSRLRRVSDYFQPGRDPRNYSPEERAAAELFHRHFNSQRSGDALTVRENYDLIGSSLAALTDSSFRVVDPDQLPEEEREFLAYVRGRDATIYLAETFFESEEPVITSASSRSTVSVLPRAFPVETKARCMIHEVAHFRLGVGHAGGVFGLDVSNCANGFPLRDFDQADDNAYAYDLFAACLGTGGAAASGPAEGGEASE